MFYEIQAPLFHRGRQVANPGDIVALREGTYYVTLDALFESPTSSGFQIDDTEVLVPVSMIRVVRDIIDYNLIPSLDAVTSRLGLDEDEYIRLVKKVRRPLRV